MSTTSDHVHNSDCVYCGLDLPFELPESIVKAAKAGRLTIFAGSGISTESSTVFPTSLYSDFKALLEIDDDDASFPSVMTSYEEAFGRRELIAEIVKRLEYVESFPAISVLATKFHDELATIGHVQTIITTNWDSAFETHCRARPFVVDEDYAYYDLPGRKVFKIHGSVNNVSTIVATQEDYVRQEAAFANSAMGSTLKHLLATQTVIFVGFSLTDPDFQSIYRSLLQGLGRARPPAYLVGPFENSLAEEFGLHVIQTDGTNFIRSLKQRLVKDGELFPDSVLMRSRMLASAARKAQNQVFEADWKTTPPLLYSIAYLDGVQDCTGRAEKMRTAGDYTYRAHLSHLVHSYDDLLKVAIAKERWWDAAYIRGYLNTIISFFVPDNVFDSFDLYEAFDTDEYPGVLPDDVESPEDDLELGTDEDQEPAPSESDLSPLFDDLDLELIISIYSESNCTSKASIEKEAIRLTERLPEGMLFRHTPFLDGVIDSDTPLPHL